MRATFPPTRRRAASSASVPGTARSTWRWTASLRHERHDSGDYGAHSTCAAIKNRRGRNPRRRCKKKNRKEASVLGRPGSDLLFQVLRLSTIGAGKFNGRVRDGIGYRLPANTTRPAKDGLKQARAKRARSSRA